MDEVEGVVVEGEAFENVSLDEAVVRGRSGGLDLFEVEADDLGVGELVGEFEGPLAGATADVEDAARLLDGGQVVATEDSAQDIMLEVEAVDLAEILGEQVGLLLQIAARAVQAGQGDLARVPAARRGLGRSRSTRGAASASTEGPPGHRQDLLSGHG